jgi:hypothetical protein
MKKQTALQWLYAKLDQMPTRDEVCDLVYQLEEEAKAMEKEQMEDMFCEGSKLLECPNELSAKFEFALYYIETYGGDK